MNKQDQDLILIEKTRHFIQSALPDDCTAHDWQHCERVFKMALLITEAEIKTTTKINDQNNVNKLVIALAALLHDLDDWKFNDQNKIMDTKAKKWLQCLNLPNNVVQHVCTIIQEIPFKGNAVNSQMSTFEGQIVQDADRLDAVGAIGIARAFAYGGFKQRFIYDPKIAPQTHASFAEYKSNQGTTINHFYEKLLLLKDRMNTITAKNIAAQRHQFMEKFLQQFFHDWDVVL